MTHPMSSETLRDIRQLTRDSERSGSWMVRELLAEVDRLTVKVAELQAELSRRESE